MIRRLNFTGRKRIAREHAAVTIVRPAKGDLSFEARLALGGYDLPHDATVWIEASHRTAFMRFPFGTVGLLQQPTPDASRLTEFSAPEGVSFRVKVTGAGTREGVILAEADGIPVQIAEEVLERRTTLLPIVPDDLGQEVWQVDFDGANGPTLLVNQRLGDWKAAASGVMFQTLVYPTALREILWHVYHIRQIVDPGDTEDWGAKWLQFGESVPGAGEVPRTSEDDGEWQQWIDDVVEGFARGHKLLDHFVAELNAEASA